MIDGLSLSESMQAVSPLDFKVAQAPKPQENFTPLPQYEKPTMVNAPIYNEKGQTEMPAPPYSTWTREDTEKFLKEVKQEGILPKDVPPKNPVVSPPAIESPSQQPKNQKLLVRIWESIISFFKNLFNLK